MKVNLREYQKQGVDNIRFSYMQGRKSVLYVLPTGGGKTVIFSHIAEQAAKKGNRVQVILECTEHKDSGMPGTSRYITTKNKKNSPDRLEIKKFNSILKKMTVHKEIR